MPKKEDDSTLYDRETKRLKNKPWAVKLVAFSVLIAGLATLITNVKTIRDFFVPVASSPPKVRVQYYTVSGHAISFLLLGMLDPTLQKHLGGKPIVWQNQVYDELRNLHNAFATQIAAYTELESPDFQKEELAALSRPSVKVMQFAVQRSIKIDEDTLLNEPLLGNPLTARGWKMAWIKDKPKSEIIDDFQDGSVSIQNLVFSKRLACKDAIDLLERSGLPGAAFLNHFGSMGCNNLTFDVITHYFEGGCEDQGWSTYIYVPGLSLEVAIIQNISDKAIKIEEIELLAAKITGIGPAKSASPLAISKGTVGDGTLLPSDRLIIPLSLRFSTEFTGSDFVEPDETYSEADLGSDTVRAHISGQAETRLVVFRAVDPETTGKSVPSDTFTSDVQPSLPAPDTIEVTIGTLQGPRLISRYGFTPNDTKDELPYIGTILSPRTMLIDGVKEKLHSIQLGAMYISDTFSGGSCPYLYAGFTEDTLLSLGKILIRRDSDTKRGTDSRYVSAWPSLVVVREYDPETTYLHSVSLVCETPAGGIIVREPVLAKSPFKHGAIELRRGESQAIEFRPLEPSTQCASVFIKVEGYYAPNSVAAPTRRLSLVTRR